MFKDLLIALETAEKHLEKGEWVTIKYLDEPKAPTWVYAGAVHKMSDGTFWRESHIVNYMIKDGVVIKHASF